MILNHIFVSVLSTFVSPGCSYIPLDIAVFTNTLAVRKDRVERNKDGMRRALSSS